MRGTAASAPCCAHEQYPRLVSTPRRHASPLGPGRPATLNSPAASLRRTNSLVSARSARSAHWSTAFALLLACVAPRLARDAAAAAAAAAAAGEGVRTSACALLDPRASWVTQHASQARRTQTKSSAKQSEARQARIVEPQRLPDTDPEQ
eukprot:216755-Chlamydomonas_euryale.AAC.5